MAKISEEDLLAFSRAFGWSFSQKLKTVYASHGWRSTDDYKLAMTTSGYSQTDIYIMLVSEQDKWTCYTLSKLGGKSVSGILNQMLDGLPYSTQFLDEWREKLSDEGAVFLEDLLVEKPDEFQESFKNTALRFLEEIWKNGVQVSGPGFSIVFDCPEETILEWEACGKKS